MYRLRFVLILFLFSCAQLSMQAQRHRRERESISKPKTNPCFDASDATEIRLWQSPAPGAVGDDSCRDVPYVQVFQPVDPSRKVHPAILVIPGGGYDNLADKREQASVAEYFVTQLHVTAFVLRYRLVQSDGTYRYPIPLWDGQRAVRLLRARSHDLGIDPSHIALLGFSAGGHLASTLALHPSASFGATATDAIDTGSAQVNLLGLGYPVISMNPEAVPPSGSYKHLLMGFHGNKLKELQHYLSGEENVTPIIPPVFLFESMDDQKISPQNSILFADALRREHVTAEVHLFRHGEHGSGLSVGIPDEDVWPSLFNDWIERQWPGFRPYRR
ncbi:alpha/beta hydrolase [Granulicella sp. dw_53]|uniref:alpha/beta hydrolase n=1 Tax=Granulicella sp. dw_53 TaxID=2719792 RepID=UPI001BD4399D|nr:alpha/beta hydrolase [Granulicella sp. dw_53]